jgi:hypothetical protein
MNRKQFYDQQGVKYDEVNAAFDDVENDLADLTTKAIGYGITSGMGVTAVAGQMSIAVAAGTLTDKRGIRVTAAPCSPIVTSDSEGATIAVPAGQERWIAVFARVSKWYCDKRQIADVDVNTGFRVQPIISPVDLTTEGAYDKQHPPTPPSTSLYLLAGTSAAIGSAARVPLDEAGILICDLHVDYGQTDYAGAGVIDFQRSEVFCRIESDQSGRASAIGTADFFLIEKLMRGTSITRRYVSHHGGMIVTVNAEKVASQGVAGAPLWKADDYSEDSLLFSFGGAYGIQGSPFAGLFKAMSVAGGAKSAPWAWADWTSRVSLP